MGRSEYKQQIYTDEHNGPSPMQILGNERAFKDLHIGKLTYYEKERKEHLDKIQPSVSKLSEARSLLFAKQPDQPVTDGNYQNITPHQRRQEISKIRANLDYYNSFKQNHVTLGHRERAIKCGWKHGITGIENADSDNTSVFFSNQKRERD